ncbi:MAG: hypothetical protein ACM34A_12015 [Bacillota bacterium]
MTKDHNTEQAVSESELFEAFAKEKFFDLDKSEHGYKSWPTAMAWQVWQDTRRAALSQVRGKAQEQSSPAVPGGYAIVPTKPTQEMTDNIASFTDVDADTASIIYRAMLAAAPQVAQEPEQAAPAVPEVMTLRKALEDLIEDIHFGPLDLQREALERARLALAAAPAAPSVAAPQVAQEEGAREKPYLWFHEKSRTIHQTDMPFAFLKDCIPLYKGPQPDAQQSIEKDAAVREAVAYHGSKWPEELYSGVMFFKGARITKAEFEGIAKEQGR